MWQKTILSALPVELARRAQHVYSEVARVADGCVAWRQGDWKSFGQLMNSSCASSINQYESGSQPLVDLHQMAKNLTGVYGSRFGGGGYGGCLIVLADAAQANHIADHLLVQYLLQYPDRKGIARAFVAKPDAGIRLLEA